MARLEIATEAEWREMANEAKELRDRLGTLVIKSSKFMPKTVAGNLMKAQKYIDQWRSQAEEEMFTRGGPQDINVFYGSDERR